MSFSRILRDRRVWIAAAVVGAVVLLRATGAADQLSLATLATHRDALAAFVASNLALAAAAYVAFYVVAVAFSLPGAVFITLAGGLLFGAAAERLAVGIRRTAASYLLVLRLVPLFPFVLVNLVPAFVGVPLRTYVAATAIGILPGTAVFSLAGAGLGDVLAMGGAFDVRGVLTPEIIAALVGLALLSLAAIPLKARFARG